MYVTELISVDKKQILVITDDDIRFRLYKGEVRRFNVTAGMNIEETVLNEIFTLQKKRCKERALYIVERADKTEKELRIKLESGDYPEEIVECTLEFLKRYDYINDYRYSCNYVRQKTVKYGMRKIKYELLSKGVSVETIDKVFAENETDSREVIRKILTGRRFDFSTNDRKQIDRQIRYLIGKGFSYEDISSVIKENQQDFM